MQTKEKPIFSVSQINEYVKYLIEADPVLDSVWVRGEISNFKAQAATGHLYFSLKDPDGVISCVMFRSSAYRLKFRPENGMRVILHGNVSVYLKTGQYQIYADSMEPDGIGALAAAYEQLRNRLAAEGLFDDDHKKPLPEYPSSVGVITSQTGAAIRDIVNILSRRYPAAKMILFPTLVQGEGAAKQLCQGIRYFNQHLPVDVIIIGRGGGSLEDLWAFNDETLARTIYASEIPVISAVGHETDYTICDFVSDRRAPTPSAAAELAVPDSTELKKRILSSSERLGNAMTNRIRSERQFIRMLSQKRVLTTPDAFIRDKRLTLDSLVIRMDSAADRQISRGKAVVSSLSASLDLQTERRLLKEKAEFSRTAAKLEALNPLSVLTRGYSAVFDEKKNTVRSVDDIDMGSRITVRFSDGDAQAEILSKQKYPKETRHGRI